MSPLMTTRVAARAIVRNSVRSLLTALGVVIGVAAVIAMMAIGAGAAQRIDSAFAAMGTDLLVVQSGSSQNGGVSGGSGTMASITWDDVAAIRGLSSVKAAAPMLRANLPIVGEEQNWTTSVVGTTPEYLRIRSWPLALGADFTQADVDSGAKVVILGRTVADHVFGAGVNPVGQMVRIGSSPYAVIGVAAVKGQSPTGQDYDDTAFMPVKTFASKVQGGLGNFVAGSLFVQALPGETSRAQRDVTALLRDRHHLLGAADNDFSIRNLAEAARAQEAGADTMTTLLASVAAVSLLVGGIGIMNIMLVSVTERTREIGLRMALGAKPRNILLQFLIEALTISFLGGLLGAALGVGAATWVARELAWPTRIQPAVLLMAVGFSAFVGVVFGLYPARKAARLDPIEALRYE